MAEAGLGLPLCPIVSLSVFLSFVYLRVTPSSFLPPKVPPDQPRVSFPLPLLPSQASKPTAPLRSFDFVKALHSLADAWTLVGCLDASGQGVTCGANVIGFIMVIGASSPVRR